MGKTVIDGRYALGQLIGADRFGEIYEAVQEKLDRKVSIKLLSSRNATAEVVSRFDTDAQALTKLHHPNIVFVEDHGIFETRPYLVTDALDGMTLEQRLEEEKRLAPDVAVPILLQIAQALEYAHQAGVLHLNLQPSQIIMKGERARVTDFGLLRLIEEEPLPTDRSIIGGSWYRSPEQARGKAADERSDLYSLGVIAFRMLTGAHPYEAPDLDQMLARQTVKNAPPLSEKVPSIPNSLSAIVDRLLQKDPDDRFPAATWVVNALKAAAPEVGVAPVRSMSTTGEAEIISAPDIEGWVMTTSAPGMPGSPSAIPSSSGIPSSPAIEDWVVPSSEPAISTADLLQGTKVEDADVPEPSAWNRQKENVKIAIGALYLIAIAAATFYFAVGLPDAAKEVRGMIRRRQAPQVIPQLVELTEAPHPDPKLRATLGLAYVHVHDAKKALREYAKVPAEHLDDADVAAIVPLLGVTDPSTMEAEKLIRALGDRARTKLRAAHDASKDPWFRCRAGEVLGEPDHLASCREVLDGQSCGARNIAIDRVANDPEAQAKLQALAKVTTSTSGEDCGYQRARAAVAKR